MATHTHHDSAPAAQISGGVLARYVGLGLSIIALSVALVVVILY